METDHHQAAADGQRFERGVKAALEIAQFIVHMDAQALECAGRRILALLPGGVGNRDHFGEISGPFERPLLTALHDGAGHPLGEALFAIFLEDPGDFLFGGVGDELRCADALAGIHAHVQGTIVEEAEAALGIVELRRRHAKVEQDAIDPTFETACAHLIAQFGERALHNDEAAVFGRQCFSCLDGLGIFVESEQASPGAQFLEQGSTMAPSSEGTVQIAAVLPRGQCGNGLLEQNGDMAVGGIHSQRIRSRSSSGSPPGCLIAARSASAMAFQASSSHN